ncbi:hypothetical protein IW262DRAFT_1464798 [Armillaria fumosa]|nr:hypothetical protein IW262DRAFT_1464798 [Armillaria fumosa]
MGRLFSKPVECPILDTIVVETLLNPIGQEFTREYNKKPVCEHPASLGNIDKPLSWRFKESVLNTSRSGTYS